MKARSWVFLIKGKPKYFKYFDNLLIFEKGRFISKLGSQDRPLYKRLKIFLIL